MASPAPAPGSASTPTPPTATPTTPGPAVLLGGGRSHEDKLFDRQVRLWGPHGQRHIRSAHVLLLGSGAALSEAAKSLVVTGVPALTVVDAAATTAADVGSNFYVSEGDVGVLPRAQSMLKFMAGLNPDLVARAVTDVTPAAFVEACLDYYHNKHNSQSQQQSRSLSQSQSTYTGTTSTASGTRGHALPPAVDLSQYALIIADRSLLHTPHAAALDALARASLPNSHNHTTSSAAAASATASAAGAGAESAGAGVPLLLVTAAGLVGAVRVSHGRREVIETHPEGAGNKKDLLFTGALATVFAHNNSNNGDDARSDKVHDDSVTTTASTREYGFAGVGGVFPELVELAFHPMFDVVDMPLEDAVKQQCGSSVSVKPSSLEMHPSDSGSDSAAPATANSTADTAMTDEQQLQPNSQSQPEQWSAAWWRCQSLEDLRQHHARVPFPVILLRAAYLFTGTPYPARTARAVRAPASASDDTEGNMGASASEAVAVPYLYACGTAAEARAHPLAPAVLHGSVAAATVSATGAAGADGTRGSGVVIPVAAAALFAAYVAGLAWVHSSSSAKKAADPNTTTNSASASASANSGVGEGNAGGAGPQIAATALFTDPEDNYAEAAAHARSVPAAAAGAGAGSRGGYHQHLMTVLNHPLAKVTAGGSAAAEEVDATAAALLRLLGQDIPATIGGIRTLVAATAAAIATEATAAQSAPAAAAASTAAAVTSVSPFWLFVRVLRLFLLSPRLGAGHLPCPPASALPDMASATAGYVAVKRAYAAKHDRDAAAFARVLAAAARGDWAGAARAAAAGAPAPADAPAAAAAATAVGARGLGLESVTAPSSHESATSQQSFMSDSSVYESSVRVNAAYAPFNGNITHSTHTSASTSARTACSRSRSRRNSLTATTAAASSIATVSGCCAVTAGAASVVIGRAAALWRVADPLKHVLAHCKDMRVTETRTVAQEVCQNWPQPQPGSVADSHTAAATVPTAEVVRAAAAQLAAAINAAAATATATGSSSGSEGEGTESSWWCAPGRGYSAGLLSHNEDQDDDGVLSAGTPYNTQWYIALRAAEAFRDANQGRAPGSEKKTWEADGQAMKALHSRLHKHYFTAPTGADDGTHGDAGASRAREFWQCSVELARQGASEIGALTGVIGAAAADAGVKLVIQQYVLPDNTLLYNGLHGLGARLEV
mgnify:CR=1 FL=1